MDNPLVLGLRPAELWRLSTFSCWTHRDLVGLALAAKQIDPQGQAWGISLCLIPACLGPRFVLGFLATRSPQLRNRLCHAIDGF